MAAMGEDWPLQSFVISIHGPARTGAPGAQPLLTRISPGTKESVTDRLRSDAVSTTLPRATEATQLRTGKSRTLSRISPASMLAMPEASSPSASVTRGVNSSSATSLSQSATPAPAPGSLTDASSALPCTLFPARWWHDLELQRVSVRSVTCFRWRTEREQTDPELLPYRRKDLTVAGGEERAAVRGHTRSLSSGGDRYGLQ